MDANTTRGTDSGPDDRDTTPQLSVSGDWAGLTDLSATVAELDLTVVTPTSWMPGYEPLGVVGEGGFGTVYKARQLSLDRDVAIKILKPTPGGGGPEGAAPPRWEAVTLAKFGHPNIVQVYDTGRVNDLTYIVMELLDGEDLSRRLQRSGPLDERVGWLVARQVVAALEHAAARGVIHRDIKPANLFLVEHPAGAESPAGVPGVKVTDFGLALSLGAAATAGSGTPAYMAPEQHRGDTVLDHRADIYALGATVFHALVGTAPFAGRTAREVLGRKLENDLRDAPNLSAASAELLGAMLAADPRRRVGDYRELLARIDRLPAVSGLPATRARPRRRRRVAASAGFVVAAAVAAAVALAPWAARPQLAPERQKPVSDGASRTLLGPGSMAEWLSNGGERRVEPDDESLEVLAVTGHIRRSFTTSEHYRVILGLDLHKATAATVQFGLPERATTGSRRLALRITRAGGAQFGSQEGEKGRFQPSDQPPAPFPSPESLVDRRPYLEVRIERYGGEWSAWFDGTLAGRAPVGGTPNAAEIQLEVEGGRARIDTAELESLKPPAQ